MRETTDRRAARPLVTILVPAKDEAEAIGPLLSSIPTETLRVMGLDHEILLLDGNSNDDTCKIAAEYGARILHDPEPGKGAAVRNAKDQVRGDYVVMLDADGTYPTDSIPSVLLPLIHEDVDVVMGTRCAQEDAMCGTHRVGNFLLSFTASLLYRRPCPDVCTGMWALRGDVFRALPLQAQGFELEAELFALSSRLHHRILCVPIDYLPRIGESKLTTLHGVRIAWHLVRMRFASLEARRSWTPGPTPAPVGVRTQQIAAEVES